MATVDGGAVGGPTLQGVIPGIVDAHLQQWNPRSTPWAANRASRLYRYVPAIGDRVFPVVVSRADREYVLTPRTVARAYEPRQYVADAAGVRAVAGVPIESVVHIESHWRAEKVDDLTLDERTSLEETRYVAGLPFGVGGNPRLGALIAHGDPRDPHFGCALDQHAAITDRFRGVRTAASRHPDPRVRDSADGEGLLAQPDFLRGFAAIADRGLVFEASVYSHQLYDVVTLAREYPETTIVVNHFGTPAGVFGPIGVRTGATAAARTDILRLWRERMTTLAAHHNIVIKISGLAMPVLGYGHERWGNIGDQATLAEMVGPLVVHVVTHFGAARVLYGSHFPIDKPNARMAMQVGALLEVLGDWGPDLLRKVFRDNAIRVYRIADPAR
ncbi:amidohydrolase family protein [Gordonia sp. ABSL1-1]|uniref:amidohydrolase family protein n=1 Tax=Gordonia sp. ABSL1-1 TaxID=3053923 RepID=UPI002572C68D|nr:amidohydrolase family protein [Gordonia sp. ABSL1-1]MDL9938915.1 amidohydrolase family protein [Gordonia sp. ABSL1-1]